MSPRTAEHMTWHQSHNAVDGEMVHPFDGEAWKHFNSVHPHFLTESRNVSQLNKYFMLQNIIHNITLYKKNALHFHVLIISQNFLLLHRQLNRYQLHHTLQCGYHHHLHRHLLVC